MHNITEAIKTLNSLLRGELAATETYQQALQKAEKEPAAEPLRRIHDEHREAANQLRREVERLGGKPDQDSGAWGTWAKLVEGTAKLFGDAAAFKALKEGEEVGRRSYEAALEDDGLPEDSQKLIRATLLPDIRKHLTALDQLTGAKAADATTASVDKK